MTVRVVLNTSSQAGSYKHDLCKPMRRKKAHLTWQSKKNNSFLGVDRHAVFLSSSPGQMKFYPQSEIIAPKPRVHQDENPDTGAPGP